MRNKKQRISIPFWTQISIILLSGILLSGVVLLLAPDKEPQKTETYTVTFAYLDGTIIDTKTVEKGKGVFPPALNGEGVFRGWSNAFNAVMNDVETHPIFHTIREQNLFYFDSVYVKEDSEFTIDIYVDGKVYVSSGTLTLHYDPAVLAYKQASEMDHLRVEENTSGELTICFSSDTPLKEKTLISRLTFYAKKKDAYSTQMNLSAGDMKIVADRQSLSADCATINNKIYFLQEIGE